VEHDHPLSGHCHADGPANSVTTAHAHLPEFAVQVLCVRLVQGRGAVLLGQFDDSHQALAHVGRQRVELAFDATIENLDCPF